MRYHAGIRMERGMFRVINFFLFILSVALPLRGASIVPSSFSSLKVYPNPHRADAHPNTLIKFENVPAASTIKLFTVSGHEVRKLSADANGLATWDRTNSDGDSVASGVYLYHIADPSGNETTGKIAVIK